MTDKELAEAMLAGAQDDHDLEALDRLSRGDWYMWETLCRISQDCPWQIRQAFLFRATNDATNRGTP